MKRSLSACLLCSFVWLAAGCTQENPHKSPPLAKVSGTVNLDGKPMGGGEARFFADGQPAQILPINGGNFSGEVHTGKNRIEIVWEKDGPPHPMNPKEFIKVNAVHSKFAGVDTPFKQDIGSGGATDLKFDVTSARK